MLVVRLRSGSLSCPHLAENRGLCSMGLRALPPSAPSLALSGEDEQPGSRTPCPPGAPGTARFRPLSHLSCLGLARYGRVVSCTAASRGLNSQTQPVSSHRATVGEAVLGPVTGAGDIKVIREQPDVRQHIAWCGQSCVHGDLRSRAIHTSAVETPPK